MDQVISLVTNVYAKFWTTDQFRIYQQAIWHEEMDESAVMNISDKREKGVRFWGFLYFWTSVIARYHVLFYLRRENIIKHVIY